MAVEYDLVVIGGGSAGLVVASASAQIGARVALVEKEHLGGDCLHYGCVPSKSLIHAAQTAYDVRHAARFGVHTAPPAINFAEVMHHVHTVMGTIAKHDAPERFQSLGIDVIFGSGQFRDRQTFAVNGQTLTARAFVIATGSRPALPPVVGLQEAGFLTNMQIFSLTAQPRSLAVIGAGPIGCELGQSLHRLGTEVTIISSRDQIMPKEDAEAAAVVQRQLEREGLRILNNARAERVEVINGQKHIQTGDQTIIVDDILVAAGRVPNVESLNLQAAEVEVSKQGVVVNAKLQSVTNPRIYACGDVIGGYQFTHVASHEAVTVIKNALFFPVTKIDYRVIPWATFTDPELARVGLTEAEARDRYGSDVYVLRQNFADVDRAQAEGATEGFAKIITQADGTILGAHMVGPSAGELIHEIVLAMANKLKVAALTGIHIYPTLAEINSKTGLQLSKQKWAKNTRTQHLLQQFFGWRRSLGR